MKLVSILSLVGQNIEGLKADIRTRSADGSLRYPEQDKAAIIVTMKSAVIEQSGPCCRNKVPVAQRVDWLVWRYDGHSCGYSGHRMDAEREEPTFIEMEERP